jgi:hypothetical protein
MDDSPSIEFLVIGAQKAGTTTLWKLLRDHPQVWLPDAKEAPFFSHTDLYDRGLEDYLRRLDAPAGGGVVRGTITPHYMQGWHDASTLTVAGRIARTLPEVRLIVLLREPLARARSQHAMELARGRERRSAEVALSESLHPQELRRGRSAPDDCNTYVVQGEYGRILGEYLSFLPRSALHVELSDSLSSDPLAVLRRVLAFIRVREDYEPAVPFERSFVGGSEPRVADVELTALLQGIDAARREGGEREAELAQRTAARTWVSERGLGARGLQEFEEIIERYLSAPAERFYRERVGLEFTLRKTWNVVPSPPAPISAALRAALEAHFEQDAPALQAAMGVRAPWSALG